MIEQNRLLQAPGSIPTLFVSSYREGTPIETIDESTREQLRGLGYIE